MSLQNQAQIETLKNSLEDEINYHKEEIDEHEVCSSNINNKLLRLKN